MSTTEAKSSRRSVARHVHRDPNKMRSVLVHPEIHRQLLREIIESGETIQECVHKHLAHSLGREDLLPRDHSDTA